MNQMYPQVAGIFYPDNFEHLNDQIDEFFSLPLPPNQMNLSCPRALVVPHAGYIYSGQVAARAYQILANYTDNIRRIVMFGPAHRAHVRGIACPTFSHYNTPLGQLEIDLPMQAHIKSTYQGEVNITDVPFYQEHCLEVQMPFIQYIYKDMPSITPILVGYADFKDIAHLMQGFDTDVLILVSSDLSHFLTYDEANQIDLSTSEAILSLKPDNLNYENACGRVALQGLLHYAGIAQIRPTLLARCNSGDTAGDKNRVVGYGSYHFSGAHGV
jgi:AmmeMemoRadiSam system protein B